MNPKSSNLSRFLDDRNERKAAAQKISEKIRLASSLAKVARNRWSRAAAYKLKVNLVQIGLERFADFISIISYEQHEILGPLLLVRLPGRHSVHVPLAAIARDRDLVDLGKLRYRQTCRRRGSRAISVSQFGGSITPAFG